MGGVRDVGAGGSAHSERVGCCDDVDNTTRETAVDRAIHPPKRVQKTVTLVTPRDLVTLSLLPQKTVLTV